MPAIARPDTVRWAALTTFALLYAMVVLLSVAAVSLPTRPEKL